MTQKQKDILLKDLCARLPYGVKVQCLSHQIPLKILSINPNGVTWVTGDKGYPFEVDWSDCKPYLFPLSSMTEEHKRELSKICNCFIHFTDWEIHFPNYEDNNMGNWQKIVSWVYKNHYDINGLIPMGLATDATDKNIY